MYLGILLKIIIVFVAVMLVAKVVQLLKLNKNRPGEVFRNSDGDFLVLVLLIAVINKSYFKRYEMSYEPIIRHIYTIVLFVFISYIIIQLTQLILVTDKIIVFDNSQVEYNNIKQMKIKKGLIRYKVTIKYIKKDKTKSVYFKLTKKASKLLEEKAGKHSIKLIR